MKSGLVLITVSFICMAARAAPCEVSQFNRPHGEIYLTAESAFLQYDDAETAINLTGQLLKFSLNCFERDKVRRLRAAILAAEKDYAGAIKLVQLILDETDLTLSERKNLDMIVQKLSEEYEDDDPDYYGRALGAIVYAVRDGWPPAPNNQPQPVYPPVALRHGMTGHCDVHLDVSKTGQPMNLRADCTNPIFEQSALDAMSKVEYAPKVVRGEAVPRNDVSYPIEYTLD